MHKVKRSNPSFSMEKRFIRPDGSVVWVNMVVASLAPVGENKLNHICIVQDITERKQIEIERMYISEHDKMTGLYNRDYLVSFKPYTNCKFYIISIHAPRVGSDANFMQGSSPVNNFNPRSPGGER
ncbi:MAG: PAS domain S-box protein, partial [Oscillospiraceae bacterium]